MKGREITVTQKLEGKMSIRKREKDRKKKRVRERERDRKK